MPGSQHFWAPSNSTFFIPSNVYHCFSVKKLQHVFVKKKKNLITSNLSQEKIIELPGMLLFEKSSHSATKFLEIVELSVIKFNHLLVPRYVQLIIYLVVEHPPCM